MMTFYIVKVAVNNVYVEVALQHNDGYNENTISLMLITLTLVEGGTQVDRL